MRVLAKKAWRTKQPPTLRGNCFLHCTPHQPSITKACFATVATTTGGIPPDFESESAQTDDSLRDDTDYLLHDIVVGNMTPRDRSLAHNVMIAWRRSNTTYGAQQVEQLLERVVEEYEAGNIRVADVNSRLYHVALQAWAHSGDDECGRRAEAILGRMEERYRKFTDFQRHQDIEASRARARPDAHCFHLTLHALAKSREEDAIERAEHLVQRMEAIAERDPEPSIQPQTATYNVLMNVYASQKGMYGIGQKTEDLLLGMAERNKDGDFSINPDTLSFNTVLKAWLNSGECAFESACRAEQLLRLMAKLGADGHNNIRPDAISFLTCLNCFGKAVSEKRKEGPLIIEHVDGLIDMAEETGAAGDDLTRFFNTAVSIITRSGVEDAKQRIKNLISRMDELRESGTLNLQPISSRTRASILAQSETETSVDEAEQLILDIIENRLARTGETSSRQRIDVIVSDSVSIGKLIHGMLQQYNRSNVERVSRLLERMEQAAKRVPGIAPHKSHYNMTIAAFANVNDDRSAFDSLELLRRQEKCFRAGNSHAKPDGFAYSSVLSQLAKSRNSKSSLNETAHQVLTMMFRQHEQGNTSVNPSNADYNIVIGLHAKACKEAATEKAIHLFRRMQTEAEAGNSNVVPDAVTMSSVLNALTKVKDRRAPTMALEFLDAATSNSANYMKLDAAFFRHVISALSQSNDLGHVDVAYDILSSTRADERGQNLNIATITGCNEVVKGFCSAGTGTDTASKAQAVLVDLVSKFRSGEIAAMPDRHGFIAVVSSWASSKSSSAMSNVEKLIALMGELHSEKSFNLKPTSFVVFNAMPIYANFASTENGVVDRAQRLVDSVDPDKRLYDALLNIVAKSREPKKHEVAKAILDKLKDANCKDADAKSYSIALKACASVTREEDREGALDVAAHIFEECKRQNKMDDVAYGTYTKVIRKCSEGAKRDSIVKELIEQAKLSGHFGRFFEKELRHLYRQKLPVVLGFEDGTQKIPSSWQRNVRRKNRK